MTIACHNILRKPARCSWLRLVTVALGLLICAPGLAWALGEVAADCSPSNSNSPSERLFTESNEHFTKSSGDLMVVPCQSTPAFMSEESFQRKRESTPQAFGNAVLTDGFTAIAGMTGTSDIGAQASSSGQTSSTNNPAPSLVEDQKQRLAINPVTGLAGASELNFSPLTGSERWKLYFNMTYCSAGTYLGPVMTALLLDQTSGTPREWGGGWPGFGRRVVSRAGTATLQSSFQAPLAALLHEDVRYISSSQHSLKRRAAHAVLYSFLTYNAQGHPTLNLASISSFYASTAVSTIWLPSIRNAARYTFSNASEQIALGFPLNVVQEFWPEIQRHVLRRH